MSPSNGRAAEKAKSRRPLSWIAVLGLLACGHSETATVPASTTPSSPPVEQTPPPRNVPSSDAPDRVAHMQATFWLAVVARNAVIAGDLESAKRAASALAEHDYAGTLPGDWRHWVAQMQLRADEVALAPDLPAAAQSLAALGLSCGDCHAQMRGGREPQAEDAVAWKDPPEDLRERMNRHADGVEQLWHGLTDPSDDAWRNGTVTLTRAPLRPALRDGEEISPTMTAQIEEVRALAKRARVAASHPERATIYGELIARCASCHWVAGVK
jgi:cytochrome c553